MTSDSPQHNDVTCAAIGLRELRKLKPIRSGFVTSRVFELERTAADAEITWCLREVQLKGSYWKEYDSGHPDEWLASYAEAVSLDRVQFTQGAIGGKTVGILTWCRVEWNNTIWLMDIRVREGSQRQGVGSALVESLRKEARRLRLRGISVETQINNYPAIMLYRKHGFELAGFNDHLYSNQDLERQDVALFLFCPTAR